MDVRLHEVTQWRHLHRGEEKRSGKERFLLFRREWNRGVYREMIFSPISIQVSRGSCLGIYGPSGSGKTMLLRMIAGQCAPAPGGSVYWDGVLLPRRNMYARRLQTMRRRCAFLFQSAKDAFHPHWTIERSFREAMTVRPNASEWNNRMRALCAALFVSEQLLQHLPHECSGGQLQRLQLIRAALTQPTLVLLDEPTSQLDEKHRHQVVAYIEHQWLAQGVTVVCVSHDRTVLSAIAQETIGMRSV